MITPSPTLASAKRKVESASSGKEDMVVIKGTNLSDAKNCDQEAW